MRTFENILTKMKLKFSEAIFVIAVVVLLISLVGCKKVEDKVQPIDVKQVLDAEIKASKIKYLSSDAVIDLITPLYDGEFYIKRIEIEEKSLMDDAFEKLSWVKEFDESKLKIGIHSATVSFSNYAESHWFSYAIVDDGKKSKIFFSLGPSVRDFYPDGEPKAMVISFAPPKVRDIEEITLVDGKPYAKARLVIYVQLDTNGHITDLSINFVDDKLSAPEGQLGLEGNRVFANVEYLNGPDRLNAFKLKQKISQTGYLKSHLLASFRDMPE